MGKSIIPVIVLLIGSCFTVLAGVSDTMVSKFTPSINLTSTRGLHETYSAEGLGEGRLTFVLSSGWYSQEKKLHNAPNKGTDIVTGMLGASFGVSSYFDIFATVSGYGLNDYDGSSESKGVGTIQGGIQGRLPLPQNLPLYLGSRISILGGTSSNQINTNESDGFNYFETRTGYDFQILLLQTLRIGKEGTCVKFHFNEGGVMTLQESKDQLLLLGGGIQVDPHPIITIGVELNSRTSFSDPKFKTDPLWISPLLQFHTSKNMQFTIGSDIALSNDRSSNSRALEPYRLFASAGLSLDLLATKRRMQKEKEGLEKAAFEKEKTDRQAVEKQNKELQAKADSLAWKAHNDSLKLVQLREQEKLRADSIAKADSIQLAETRKNLEMEKSKRTDAEKQLLSTGLLLLDAVYFESGKSDISINSEPYLIIISKMLLKYPKLLVEVSGHTDNIGSVTKNMNLSQARAEAVRYFVVQSSPELATRLSAKGYGSSRPKANNAYAEGRKVNRRVELQVLNKEVLSEYNR